jgi:Tol biopolymer transport system component/DNA-binding winged helix-turn-helix (wHTH) protein
VKEQKTKEFYDFGGFRLDTYNRLLWHTGKTVALTPKEFELLLVFVENAGQVLTKDNLLDKIWAETFVEESTLARNISWLRKKLDAGNESGEKFIETCPKRGYRFLPEVTKSSGENTLVIEEQTLMQIRVEETISLSDSSFDGEIENANGDQMLKDHRPSGVRRLNSKFKIQNSKLIRLVLGLATIALIGFGVYQNFFARHRPKVVLTLHAVPFSGLIGRENSPAFSPDNKQIAFVWNGGEGEIQDIYVRLIGTGEPVRLTKGEKDALVPVFSPDGRGVAFSRSFPDTSKIYIVPALGGAERKIAEVQSGGTSFSFMPDGQTIAVADRDSANSNSGIFFVNVETGAKQRLTAPPLNFNDHSPRISPDGKSIVFLRAASVSDMDLYIVSVAGGEAPRRLTFDQAQINGLAWNADRESVIFSSRRGQSLSANLWQIPVAGDEPVPVMTGGKNPVNPTVAPDGKTIAYGEEFEDINIWRLIRSESVAGVSGFKKFIASARSDHSQQISPDGGKIVFVSERTGNSEIWLANADGSNPLQLTTLNGAGSPRFSPDGKNIAFGRNIEGKGEIFVISAEGGAPRRLTENPARDVIPAWSADGRSIYFTSDRSGELQIWKMSADGGEARQITQHGAFEAFESPDGKTLFYSKERGVAGLWRVASEGGEETPAAELAEAGYWRSWTVTQSGVYYVARSSGPPYKIMFYNFSDGQTRELAATEKMPLWNFSGLSVSPDGNTILYAQEDQNASSIMLAELGK